VFGLEALAAGDHRAALADATADPDVAACPLALVVTGLPWRTDVGGDRQRHRGCDPPDQVDGGVAVQHVARPRFSPAMLAPPHPYQWADTIGPAAGLETGLVSPTDEAPRDPAPLLLFYEDLLTHS
jgi:hypothetical protein